MNIVPTRDQVARHFNVHLRTAAAWFAAGCPGQRGAYDLEQIAAWRNRPRPAKKKKTLGKSIPEGFEDRHAQEPSPPAAAIAELAAAVNRLAAALERTASR